MQVANLELVTQKIEIKAKALIREPTPRAKTYASVASTGLEPSAKAQASPQEWVTVSKTKPNRELKTKKDSTTGLITLYK